jgi:hypothetical protein
MKSTSTQRQATYTLQEDRATWNVRWLPVMDMQSLAGQAQYIFLAIQAMRFFLRELQSVVGEKWRDLVRLAPHIRRVLQ